MTRIKIPDSFDMARLVDYGFELSYEQDVYLFFTSEEYVFVADIAGRTLTIERDEVDACFCDKDAVLLLRLYKAGAILIEGGDRL